MAYPLADDGRGRCRRWLGAAALTGTVLLVVGTPVQAEPTIGGFKATTWASAARSSYTVGTSLVSEIFDGPGPIAQASLDSLGGSSFASLPYPGSTAAGYPQFTALVVPQSVPGYPFWAVADQTSPEAAFADPTNSYGYKAKVGPGSAFGEAKLRPAAGQSAATGSIVTSAVEATGNQVVARAQSVTDGLDLGMLRVASIHSSSVTTFAAGGQPKTETSLTVEGGRAGDLTFSFGPGGLKVQQNNVALPLSDGLSQLNKALEPAKISVSFLPSEPIQGGARSESFEVRNVHPDPTSQGSNGTLSVRFGEVISSVVAEGEAPVTEAGPSGSAGFSESPAGDAGAAPEQPAPAEAAEAPAAASSSDDRLPAGTSPSFSAVPDDGGTATGVASTGAAESSSGNAETTGAAPAEAALAPAEAALAPAEAALAPAEAALAPAAPAAARPAAAVLRASTGRLYGTLALSVAVLVLLSTLWRRGVQR